MSSLDHKKFSVLLSVYHSEKASFLSDSLTSLFSQTWIPSEVILVKDGELPSDLNDTINSFKLRFPEIIQIIGYEKNMGLGYALQYGLNYCQYDFVARVDSDDISRRDRFECQLKFLLANRDISIVGGWIEEFNLTPGDLNRYRKTPIKNKQIQQYKFKRNPFNHMTVMFRKHIVLQEGGYTDLPYFEDYFLWIKLLENNKGYNIPNVLVDARIGNGMISRRTGLKYLKKELYFQLKLLSNSYITYPIFLRNVFSRVFIRGLPSPVLSWIYKNVLRD